MVLLPGAAHMSRTAWPGLGSSTVTGIIETFSCLKRRPVSVSVTMKRWNYFNSLVCRSSALPISLNDQTESWPGYQRTGFGTLCAKSVFLIASMYLWSSCLVRSEFGLQEIFIYDLWVYLLN